MGSSPSRTGPLAVPNKYQVSPSLAMEGSCVYSMSPSTFTTCGIFSCLSFAWANAGVKRQMPRTRTVLFRIAWTFRRNKVRGLFADVQYQKSFTADYVPGSRRGPHVPARLFAEGFSNS